MSDSDFDPPVFDISRITFAPQDGIAQFESVAREFRSDILGFAVTANENHGTGCY
jgi:hypothetical protein